MMMRLSEAFAQGCEREPADTESELVCQTCWHVVPEVTMSWHECTDCAAKRANT
jgi:Zn finger protein HypA/HybF involved in hydrogenase expression